MKEEPEMPARRRLLDPTRSDLESFSFDLRMLGKGKAPIPHIAEYSAPLVSRAALYAALSGQRVPSRRTLSTLLQWWIAVPPVLRDDDEYEDRAWPWSWIDDLPPGDRGRKTALQWMDRRDQLAEGRGEPSTPRAEPVVIPLPPEQQVFIDALREVLEIPGVLNDSRYQGWYEGRLFATRRAQRAERYLAGKCIPTGRGILRLCEELADGQVEDFDKVLHLVTLAEDARAARRRDRHIARKAAQAASS